MRGAAYCLTELGPVVARPLIGSDDHEHRRPSGADNVRSITRWTRAFRDRGWASPSPVVFCPGRREESKGHVGLGDVLFIEAGALYAIIVFVIGFILGTMRLLLLVPRLGATTAVIFESPVMLAASWFVCRWCVDSI